MLCVRYFRFGILVAHTKNISAEEDIIPKQSIITTYIRDLRTYIFVRFASVAVFFYRSDGSAFCFAGGRRLQRNPFRNIRVFNCVDARTADKTVQRTVFSNFHQR